MHGRLWREERSRKRNGQADGGESAGATNLACFPIIRGGVPSRDKNVDEVAHLKVSETEVKVLGGAALI